MLLIYNPAQANTLAPLAATPVPAGFPSPADDYVEEHLDLAQHLIQHPNATFYVRVTGESMNGAGIQDGDILVVDRSLDARDGDVVVAAVNGEFTVKRLRYRLGQPWLVPANPAYKAIMISEDMETQIWGVVTSVVHQYRR
jgi:DNA polymerase V